MHGHIFIRDADAYFEIGEHGCGGAAAENDGQHDDDRRRRHDHVTLRGWRATKGQRERDSAT